MPENPPLRPKPRLNGRQLAYIAQIATGEAIHQLHTNGQPMDTAKALALAKLVSSLASIRSELRRMKSRAKPRQRTKVVHQVKPVPASQPPTMLGEPELDAGTVLEPGNGLPEGRADSDSETQI